MYLNVLDFRRSVFSSTIHKEYLRLDKTEWRPNVWWRKVVCVIQKGLVIVNGCVYILCYTSTVSVLCVPESQVSFLTLPTSLGDWWANVVSFGSMLIIFKRLLQAISQSAQDDLFASTIIVCETSAVLRCFLRFCTDYWPLDLQNIMEKPGKLHTIFRHISPSTLVQMRTARIHRFSFGACCNKISLWLVDAVCEDLEPRQILVGQLVAWQNRREQSIDDACRMIPYLRCTSMIQIAH